MFRDVEVRARRDEGPETTNVCGDLYQRCGNASGDLA